ILLYSNPQICPTGADVRQLQYNIQGLVSQAKMPNGAVHKFTYDELYRLVYEEIYERASQEVPVETIAFDYDNRDRLVKIDNSHHVLEFEYDGAGFLTKETINGREVLHDHDEITGQRVQVKSCDLLAKFVFSPGGLPKSISFQGAVGIDLSYNPDGIETQRHTSTGFASVQTYGQSGELISQTAGKISPENFPSDDIHSFSNAMAFLADLKGAQSQRIYKYDSTARISQIADRTWGSTDYSYTNSGQVKAVSYDRRHSHNDLREERFGYDNNHNLKATGSSRHRHASLDTGIIQHAFSSVDQQRGIAGRIERRGECTFAYDVHGRLITRKVVRKGFRPQIWHFEWDHRDRLSVARSNTGETWKYTYDPFGRRQSKTCIAGLQRGQETAYLWDADAMVEAVTTASGEITETIRYLYDPGTLRPAAQEVNGELQYIVCDHLGTPTELFSEAGDLLWSRKLRLWGEDYGVERLRAANDNGGYVDCLIRFQGQFFDAETGLHYNRHRYYDPYAAEYLSPDPIGLAGGLRSFGYVTDPTSWVDPLGLAGCKAGLSPKSFDLETLSQNPRLHRHWTNAMKSAASSTRKNGYQRYLETLSKGNTPTTKQLESAFSAVNQRFMKLARADGFDIAQVHHWNYNKGSYPTQIVDPRHLVPVSSRDLHTILHRQTTSNPGNIWKGPISPEHVINIPDWSTPLPSNWFKPTP
ncbi:RHS repeat domain-containing protein, partial [Halocynthiibacter sp.]|uniref:RHS repeat domain-containing protein n=1 Tax=Halocynthiibacter sp. TaxID=1979210 RepID=UPI003C493500